MVEERPVKDIQEVVSDYQQKRAERLERERETVRALVPTWARDMLDMGYVEPGSDYISKYIRYHYDAERHEYLSIRVKVVGFWIWKRARYYFNEYSSGELVTSDLQRMIAHAVTYKQEYNADRGKYRS
jgi:hypothetical protein